MKSLRFTMNFSDPITAGQANGGFEHENTIIKATQAIIWVMSAKGLIFDSYKGSFEEIQKRVCIGAIECAAGKNVRVTGAIGRKPTY